MIYPKGIQDISSTVHGIWKILANIAVLIPKFHCLKNGLMQLLFQYDPCHIFHIGSKAL